MLREWDQWDQWAARVEGERTQNGNRYQDTLLGGPLLEKEYRIKTLRVLNRRH